MSSAILYVAIVAIWAIVLIPRWLKRDSSAEAAAEATTAEDTPAAEEEPAPPPPLVREDDTARTRAPGRRRAPEDLPSALADRPRALADRPRRPEDRPRRAEDRPRRAEDRPRTAEDGREDGLPEEVRRGPGRGQEHARVVSARRRLLGLLVALTSGACALAVTRTAASWVVAPPAVMLVGYLGLLREASKTDAERRDMTRARSAHPAAADRRAAAAGPATPPARVPEAKIIDISTSRGAPEQGGEEFYDQYADAKLRAVGD